MRSALLLLAIIAVSLRAGFVLSADPQQLTFHSGGSDAPIYESIAQNLLRHVGFTYQGQPTAFHAPGYPVLVAGFMRLFGSHWITAIRWLQFLLGLLTIAVCALAAVQLFDSSAATATMLLGLFLPTLIFPTAQVLPECLSACLTALFLYFLVKQYENSDLSSATGMALSAGFGSLVRFNAAALPLFALWSVVSTRKAGSPFLRGALVLVIPLAVISPWLVRNEMTFHGQVLFSTESGGAALMGVLTPEGRTQPGDAELLETAMSAQLKSDNGSIPLTEVEGEKLAMRAAVQAWRSKSWSSIPFLMKKAMVFWLSTDQLVDTKSFRLRERLIRAGGVLAYWIVLAFGIRGWFYLRRTRPCVANVLLMYALTLTVLHLPLTTNTRIRIPLMDPLIVVLSGAGWTQIYKRLRADTTAIEVLPDKAEQLMSLDSAVS